MTTRPLTDYQITWAPQPGPQTIHRLAGSAMTKPELDRIMPTLPNEGDSPAEYVGKMENALKTTENAIMRASWLQSRGMQITD
jgi:hypothetical protein